MDHTKGKLIIKDHIHIASESGAFVPSYDNARRLVACWNACDGIGTDELEKIEVKRNMRVAAMEYAALSADRDRLQAINAELVAALERKFHGGSRVINCIQHGGGKPEECRLCVTDLKNQLSYAIRVNEFLNSVLDDARAALAKSKEAQS